MMQKYFSDNDEYILCYAKNKEKLRIKGIKKTEKQKAYYKNYDNDPRGDYLLTPLHAKSGVENSIYTYVFKMAKGGHQLREHILDFQKTLYLN